MCSQIPNTSDLLKQFGLQVKETKAISIKLVLHILQQNVKVKKAMAYTRTWSCTCVDQVFQCTVQELLTWPVL